MWLVILWVRLNPVPGYLYQFWVLDQLVNTIHGLFTVVVSTLGSFFVVLMLLKILTNPTSGWNGFFYM